MSAEHERALSLALRYVARRERTASEVRRYLAGRIEDGTAVEEALTELGVLGLLDDARYARMFSEDKRNLEGWGSERIRRELSARGVARETVEAVMAGQPPEDERARALEILHRRFPGTPVDRRVRERALAVLLRKGYDTDLALDAVSSWAAAGATRM